MERFVCVHGHFYQPPRENPWLEDIELQDSAFPYHDWNERIAAECYGPNARSRILNHRGKVVHIHNNYSKMSFNFGPTLLSWMKLKAPEIYQDVLDADRKSQRLYSGHGSALSQVYNHMILPLANGADRFTQVYWGMKDFEYRFQRKPEGMWLSEAAVDNLSLDMMAEQGIKFTILAPHQAKRIRRLGSEEPWQSVEGGRIDPRQPYLIRLPSGRSIAVFFYDGPVAERVAFGGLLGNGERFANRLAGTFESNRNTAQLVHIATDGETYGHHHKYGDMALAYALHHIEAREQAKLINYGEFLEKFPPVYEAEIVENTSWSCVHGIERWRGHCGCHSGKNPSWKQYWREHLRNALDWLRDTMAQRYEYLAGQLLKDPWKARNDYIQVVLNRTPETIDRFFEEHSGKTLSPEEKVRAMKLFEVQRHSMLMYTSCGWFFDDLSELVTIQCLQYAGRVIQLSEEVTQDKIEGLFLDRLQLAKSNLALIGDGRSVYQRNVKPAIVDFQKVGAHYAISSLFTPYKKKFKLFSFGIDSKIYKTFSAGKARLVIGKANIISDMIQESADLAFCVVSFGEHNINAGVKYYEAGNGFDAMLDEAESAFSSADFPALIRVLDKHFGGTSYSIRSLFKDEQRRVLDVVLKSVLERVEESFTQLYEEHTPVMRFLTETGTPLPKAYKAIADFVRNRDIVSELESHRPNVEQIQMILREVKANNLLIDNITLAFHFEKTIDRLILDFQSSPYDTGGLEILNGLLSILAVLRMTVNLWKAQNIYYDMAHSVYSDFLRRQESGDQTLKEWVKAFKTLGRHLSVKLHK